MKKMLFIAFLFCCFSVNLCAQKYHELFYQSSASHSELPFSLRTQAQNLEDFIARFNGYHNAYGDSIDTQDPRFQTIRSNKEYWKTWRMKLISSLMTPKLIDRDSTMGWHCSRALSSIDHITMDHSCMSAYLSFEIMVADTEVRGSIELHFIELEGDRYEWVIHDAYIYKGTPPPDVGITALEPVRNPNVYLPPNSHGNGFLLLKRKIKANKSISPYINESKEVFDTLETLLSKSSSISFYPEYYVFHVKGKAVFRVDDEFSLFMVDTF